MDKINNAKALADTGLRIIHINKVDTGGRSVTIAYKGTSALVEIATAVTHPDDVFTRKVGTQKAIEAFVAGRTIRVPVPRDWQGNVALFVQNLFAIL